MDYLKLNKKAWDAKTKIHVKSSFYDVPAFKAGNNTLNDIEMKALGDVSGKSLLHLQCHFGLDSLSWARLGAKVTGVDLSSVAIKQAQDLSEQCDLHATFICDDVINYLQKRRQFDVVFTSYGTICWLSDIKAWAQGVARQLKPGGTFFMAEFHPVYDLLDGYSYFHQLEPDVETETVYTENKSEEKQAIAVWSHPLGEVISALLCAGLSIQAFEEFDYSPYDCFDNMEERQAGQFHLQHKGNDIPLVYALKAVKECSEETVSSYQK
ncbi:class I SAM-dependent methyltransferase [Marinicella rhabdoformis]|uniref:class I SAM-dependent methyltransferase n=1 Tax=Marinicella rhabdoformis TaxID=2580566 RepID=UPI0012AEB711|nr:class I SAM-dependent methyltransferase [Marinicella rhabdoformis]